ncbi:MAG: hypothetical protein ACKVXR_17130 [Planctomycetota bacterium]
MKRPNHVSVPVLALAALTAAFVAPADSLTFHVEAKSKLTKTFETRIKLASESMSITVDGNDMHGGVEVPKIEITDNETIQVTDEYLSVEDGRPTKLVRDFVDLAGDSLETSVMPEDSGMEDREEKGEKESPLEGKTVVFTWEDDGYKAAWADEEKGGDDELLEKLEGDMDLLGFLPSKGVAKGDTWDLEAKAFNGVSSPGGRLHLRTPKRDEADENLSIQEELEKNIGGEGKATYKGTRDVDGVEVGVIEITAELESHGTVEADGRENSIEYAVTYTGEMLWNVKAGRLHSLELQGEVKFSMDTKSSIEFGEESHELRQKVEFAGTIEHRATVE